MESVLVKIQVFTMSGDGVYDGACFFSPWRGSLFLVKLQVPTINYCDGVYHRACLCLTVVVVCF